MVHPSQVAKHRQSDAEDVYDGVASSVHQRWESVVHHACEGVEHHWSSWTMHQVVKSELLAAARFLHRTSLIGAANTPIANQIPRPSTSSTIHSPHTQISIKKLTRRCEGPSLVRQSTPPRADKPEHAAIRCARSVHLQSIEILQSSRTRSIYIESVISPRPAPNQPYETR